MNDNIEQLYAEAETLLSAALEAEAQEAGAQFQRACEIYAEILAINPQHYDGLLSWGYALTCQRIVPLKCKREFKRGYGVRGGGAADFMFDLSHIT